VNGCVDVLADRDAGWEKLEASAGELVARRKLGPAVPRMRQLLGEELAMSPLRMPPGAHARSAPGGACAAGSGESWPRAAFLVRALAGQSAAQPELEAAYRSGDPDVTREALWALAGMTDDLVLPELIQKLTSEVPPCRAFVVIALRRYGERARAALPALLRELERGCSGAIHVIEAIGAIADPSAAKPLAGCLQLDDFRARAAALDGLARLGPAAGEYASLVDRLTDDWAPVVRTKAAEALRAIAGAPPRTYAAPLPVLASPTATGWDLALRAGTLPIASIVPGPPPPACREDAQREGAIDAIDAGGACLLAVNRGEFGGWLVSVDRTGVARRSEPVSGPLRLVLVHGDVLLLSEEGLLLVDRSGDGRIWPRLVARLPGPPRAYGLDGTGDLVVVAEGSREVDPAGSQGIFVLRLARRWLLLDER
jgi:hypothetical protein